MHIRGCAKIRIFNVYIYLNNFLIRVRMAHFTLYDDILGKKALGISKKHKNNKTALNIYHSTSQRVFSFRLKANFLLHFVVILLDQPHILSTPNDWC